MANNKLKNKPKDFDNAAITAEKLNVDNVSFVSEKPEPKEPELKTVIGYVTDCIKLNIREEPRIDSNILCITMLNEELTVDVTNLGPEEPDDDYTVPEWLHVYTKFGIEGYCMRKYVHLTE